MKLLLCDDGTPASKPALGFGEHFARLLGAEITILEIREPGSSTTPIAPRVVELHERLTLAKISCQIIRGEGIPRQAILTQVKREAYSLVMIGLLKRGSFLRRWLRGPSVRRILQSLEPPLMVVPEERQTIDRILICSGDLWCPAELIQIVSEIARASRAEVTILYVVPPIMQSVPMGEYLKDAWGAILQSEAPQARRLKESLETLRVSGIEARLNLRHGQVLEQIKAEIQEGEYDLVALGSTYASKSLYRLFTRSVTDFVVETAQRPVLVVRHQGGTLA